RRGRAPLSPDDRREPARGEARLAGRARVPQDARRRRHAQLLLEVHAGPMIVLYYAPRTRAVRIRWLLEELGLPYELRRVPFAAPQNVFTQATPLGKFPVIEDGDVTIGESGAILEYVLERYGDGRLAPAIGSSLRGPFLQWVHFAESTAFPPLGTIVWH